MTGTTETNDILGQATEAALRVAADRKWDDVSLLDIARAADLSIDDFYGKVSRDRVRNRIEQDLDRACSAEPADLTETPRTRIFDIIMLRIEAMDAHRDALLSIRDAERIDVSARLKQLKRRRRTARWVLSCAGLDATYGEAGVTALMGIIARAEEVWTRDLNGDFAQTMAKLDRDLRRVEGWAARFGRGKADTPPPAEADVAEA